MAVVILDGSTVRDFVADVETFHKAIDLRFHELDVNHDGVLCPSELRTAFESMRLIESHFGMPDKKTPDELNALYDSVFQKFDTDRDGKIDLPEFRSQMEAILLAIADGLGSFPLQMVVEEGSLLQDAVDHEAAQT